MMNNRLQVQKRHRKAQDSTAASCIIITQYDVREFAFRNPNMTEHDVEDLEDEAGINLSQASYDLASKITFRKLRVNVSKANHLKYFPDNNDLVIFKQGEKQRGNYKAVNASLSKKGVGVT